MKLDRSVITGMFYVLVLFVFTAACTVPQGAPGRKPSESTTSPITSQAPSPMPTKTAEPTQTEVPTMTSAPTETATPTFALEPATPNPQSLCPQPGVDTSLYISKENGFCFLVPAGFKLQDELQRPGEVVTLLGPTEPMGPKQQEAISVFLSVEANGPADGMDSSTYAREWYDRFATPEDPFDPSDETIAGQPATVLRDLPGYTRQQAAFVIANEARYRINLSPQPGDSPELAEAAQRGWEALVNSLVFFPPEKPVKAVRPADACPKEDESTRLYINEIDGYCYLYPAEFKPVSDFPGAVTGGPVVGQWEGGEVRSSVTVGNFGAPGDMTPSELLDQRIDFVQPGSIEETTIGGYPAVTFIDINGAWPSRQAIIVVNAGRAYSVLAQPLDEARFPDAPPYVDLGWETVTGSLAFFDPWR